MHEELVKRIRNRRICIQQSRGLDLEDFPLMKEAADAIEKLSCRETPMRIIEIHVDEYYCPACGAENNCDQGYVQDAYCPACGQRLLPEPPEEER